MQQLFDTEKDIFYCEYLWDIFTYYGVVFCWESQE